MQINLIGTFRCIAKRRRHVDAAARPGRRSRRHRQHRIGCGRRRPDGPGGLLRIQGWRRWHDLPIARDLSGEAIRINTILPGIFNTPLMNAAPQNVKDALGACVPFPKRLGNPEEYASLALEMIKNTYFNGEDVRLDGAIRMGLK
jgi:hypothetical protein